MCDPVRLHPTQTSDECDSQARALAENTPTQPDLSWSRSALEDALGSWLDEEQHASTELLTQTMNDAVTGMQLYREMWRDSDDAWGEALERMKVKVEARDILINMLSHACLKMMTSQPDDIMEERLQPVFDYASDMRSRALDDGTYECRLMSQDELRGNVNMEITAEVLIDLTTDEDTETENEIIDLTYDSDEEMDGEEQWFQREEMEN